MSLRVLGYWSKHLDRQKRNEMLEDASSARVAQHGDKKAWTIFTRNLSRDS